jgi:hypothetical protein
MAVAKVDKWIVAASCFVMFVVIPAACIIAVQIVQGPRMASAEAAVSAAAAGLARGQLLHQVTFNDAIDRAALTEAFASGWHISRSKPAGVGLNTYEVMVRVPTHGQYNFTAQRLDGQWHVGCCSHLTESELRDYD